MSASETVAAPDFAKDLRDGLGDKIMDDEIARSIWSALANVDWYHPASHTHAAYSFREAGALIAKMRGTGSYTDWYCCGPYSQVTELIWRTMKKRGWIYDRHPDICDEPGCLRDNGCGWQSDRGYRHTCAAHMKGLKP